jgi:hypothetical protein
MEKRWRKESTLDVVAALLGLLLFVSPWVSGFVGDSAANWNAWLCGTVIAVLAITGLVSYAEWQQWLSLVIVGAWVTVSPWVLGFSADPTAMRVHLIAGTLVAVGAAVRAWTMSGGMPRMTA